MVVQGDKLDVNCFRQDEFLNRGRTFVVHYVQCRIVATGFQYGDDFGEDCTMEASVRDSSIKVVDIYNKHTLHTIGGADQEGAGDVSIHGARYGIGERGKAEHILHSTDFLRGKHAINLDTCGDNVKLHVRCGGCIGLVSLHVSLVGSGGARQMVFDVVVKPGMVASSSMRSSAQRSVDAGGEHMIWWM